MILEKNQLLSARSLESRTGMRRNCLCAIMALMVFWAGCGMMEDESVPPQIIGHWTTDAKGYEDCFMDISEAVISFHTVEGTTDVNFIQKVKRRVADGQKVYDIHYQDRDGSEFLLSVFMPEIGQQGRMVFYNQKYLTWNKVDWEIK